MANGVFGGGTGTIQDPYIIEDAHDLNSIRRDLNGHYLLKNDINLGITAYTRGEGWEPIMNFAGTLNGNNKKIFNLYINKPSSDYVGLFGDVRSTPRRMFKDFGLVDVDITGRNDVGAIVGRINVNNGSAWVQNVEENESPIDRCYVTGKVAGSARVGGFIGYFNWNPNNGHVYYYYLITNSVSAVNLVPRTTSVQRASFVGRVTNSQPGTTTVRFSNLVSFSTLEPGSNANSIAAYDTNYAGTAGVITNCFFDKTLWKSTVTTSSIGLSTEELKTRSLLQALVGILNTDGSKTWTIRDGLYPQLHFASIDNLFIQADGNFLVYDAIENKWVVQFSKAPNRFEALEKGMKSFDNVTSEAWNQLKIYNSVEIVNIIEKTSKKETKIKDVTFEELVQRGSENKKVFIKEFTFSHFGDDIDNIST